MVKSQSRVIKVILFVVPFVLGVTGYLVAGLTISDSLYASIALYGMDPFSDELNIWIETARWTAPIATATAILYAFKKAWHYLSWRVGSFFHDSVAIYTDSDIEIQFGEKVRAIYSSNIKSSASSHIILMENDEESVNFYKKNCEKLKNKKVYIALREMDLGLMKEDTNDVSYFDIYGSISRLLWKKIGLWNRKTDQSINIVIWGSGNMAEKILSSGLLLNIFSLTQHIRYVMVGDEIFHVKHPKLQLMNDDEIVYLPKSIEIARDELADADILIIAEEVSATLFQMLVAVSRNSDIYYYSHYDKDNVNIISSKLLSAFGKDADIYTDECIRQEKLIAEAVALNAEYAEKYNGISDWKKLSGFLKWSNISSADYVRVVGEMIACNPDFDMEEFAEMEHIRWCRFHFLNYWTFGILEDGKVKDPEHRIHSCLRPYGELTQEMKEKDRDVIRQANIKEICQNENE